MTRPFRLTAPPNPLEHQEQVSLFQFAALQSRIDYRWGLLNASQNGMRTTPHQARAAKAADIKKGFPDLSFPVPSGGYHGLYIELKRKDGVPSDVKPEQREWLDQLNAQGYLAVVAFGWEQAKEQIETYLRDDTPAGGALTPAGSDGLRLP